jgi:hypothetical protein
MEDPSRILGEDRGVAGTDKRSKFSGRWSVLLIDDMGQTISFYLSKRVGYAIAASFAVILILFIYFAISFMLMIRENTALQKNFDLLTADLQRAKSDTEKALVQLMLLKESSNPTVKKPVPAPVREPKDVARSEEETLSVADTGSEVEVPEKIMPADVAPQPPPPKEITLMPGSRGRVAVDKLQIWQKSGDNDFSFRYVVKNANREGGKVSGYTFLVLMPHESGGAVPPRAFPDTRLEGGKPSDFRHGLYFSISRFKSVDGTLTDISVIRRYKTATIYAYSDTGVLLIERVFEISKVLGA